MILHKIPPNPPLPTYKLEMDYTELHELYHFLLDYRLIHSTEGVVQELFQVLRDHA